MNNRWEGYFHLGIVYPKLFVHANSGEGDIIETLSGLLHNPFFTAIEIVWIKMIRFVDRFATCWS